ncbi:MAG: response regulator transcription factor [Nevskiaceae bacterium]|nr:MAG: response regulator transcription factor [Nevskiaceae bacterium]
MNAATVYLVDDDEAVRGGLRALLAAEGLAVQAHADAQSFLDRCPADAAGCLLLDVNMPGLSGLDLQARLRTQGITLPVIMLTGCASVPAAVQALKAGAVDFLEKPCDADRLLTVVRAALTLDRQQREQRQVRLAAQDRLAQLTAREHEILRGLTQGHANKRIAYDLGISERTVEQHRASVLRKCGVRTVAELLNVVGSAGNG